MTPTFRGLKYQEGAIPLLVLIVLIIIAVSVTKVAFFNENNNSINKTKNKAVVPVMTKKIMFHLNNDRIFYNQNAIDKTSFKNIVLDSKKNEKVIEITYSIDSTTGSFVENIRKILNDSGVKYSGI